MGFHLRTTEPTLKLGHREQLSGGVGTGRALNSDQVVCVTVAEQAHDADLFKVATGWVDGAVRVFDVSSDEATRGSGIVQSLIHENENDDEFLMREPLVLNGHSGSPVRSLAFDPNNGTRLASGSSDGSVVLWDIVAETGLFRLLGHRGGITDIHFATLGRGSMDYLISSSLDGLVKVWDLKGQCCTQTIPTHKGEVWGIACKNITPKPGHIQEDTTLQAERIRMLTGSNDGQVRVWAVDTPKRYKPKLMEDKNGDTVMKAGSAEQKNEEEDDDADNVCSYMGTLIPPANVSTSADRISCIHYHPSGNYVGILHNNSKNVDVYLIRSTQEAQRKRQRRLRRRKEKSKISAKSEPKGQKRGILDDPEDEYEVERVDTETSSSDLTLDPEMIKASDEFEYFGTARASHKVKGFTFVPFKESGGGVRIVCALTTNALEVHSLIRSKGKDGKAGIVESNKVSTMNMYGHPTGIRAVELSSDDSLACTVSKNTTKIWNVSSRSCIQSLSPSVGSHACYGLCAAFLPGNTHFVLGTREGHLLLLDISSGDVIYIEENAHDGAVWSIDLRRPTADQPSIAIVTGSADKTVKFWDIEAQDDGETPMLSHARTLEMTDDVVATRYSHSTDPSKRMVFVSTLDSTIKVFFEDTLKFFLSLYGHKLPALALDAADDDTILATSGADKTIKIWGLDFGDTHRTLHGHEDSITDLKFVRRTHNFFTTSKDGTVRYWDGDRFEQILILNGHAAEVNCLAINRTGAFVLSGGMDRQIRVWERTKDMVFLEEEREREMEDMFDRMDGRDEGGTASIMKKKESGDDESDAENDDQPQSEAAVKKSVMSVAAGDRILEAIERADQEMKEAAAFRRSNPNKERSPNPLMLGMEPSMYILWVLKSIKHVELEQSLLVLPLGHVERLLYYLVVLLRSGRGTELCARVSVFLVKIHQNQVCQCNCSSLL